MAVVTHLLAVAATVGEQGGTEDEVIAALPHDAVEDQGGAATLATIRERFGDTVAEIVAACSDTDEVPKSPWRERKERSIAHLAAVAPAARLVSAADKLHKARAILADLRAHGEAVWGRFNGGGEGTLWYYRSLVGAYTALGRTALTAELDAVIGEIERLTGLTARP